LNLSRFDQRGEAEHAIAGVVGHAGEVLDVGSALKGFAYGLGGTA
jgi:hypothetical protein